MIRRVSAIKMWLNHYDAVDSQDNNYRCQIILEDQKKQLENWASMTCRLYVTFSKYLLKQHCVEVYEYM